MTSTEMVALTRFATCVYSGPISLSTSLQLLPQRFALYALHGVTDINRCTTVVGAGNIALVKLINKDQLDKPAAHTLTKMRFRLVSTRIT